MTKPVICIGAALVDELFHVAHELLLATTCDARVSKTAGGVSRNIAHQLALLGVPVQLISVFGNDNDGNWLKNVCRDAGVQLDASITREGYTGKYTGIINVDGSLHTAFLTNAANHLITPEHLSNHMDLLQTASFILADANINVETVEWLLAFSRETGIPFILEPVSVPPARKFRHIHLKGLYLVTPNEDELPQLCTTDDPHTHQQVNEILGRGVEQIWLHTGRNGSALYGQNKSIALHAPAIDVLDCTGAGDGSLAGFILGKCMGMEDLDCLKIAHTLSAEILQVQGAIATHLTQQKLMKQVRLYYPD